MSEIKVDKISPQSGTALAVGDSGDTIPIPSGATITNSGPANGFGVGKILQVVNSTSTAVATTTTTTPFDDTIPQSGEGGEFLTQAITPDHASNKLLITFNGFTTVNPTAWMTIALFQDSTAGALAATTELRYGNTWGGGSTLIHYMAAGTTSSTTFKIRIGLTSGTVTLNGQSGGRLFGGVCSSSLTIMEIEV